MRSRLCCDFLDLEPVHVRDLAELRKSAHCNSSDCLAVIARRDTVTALGAELVAQLRAMRQPLPVICISADGLAENRREQQRLGLVSSWRRRSSSAACRQSEPGAKRAQRPPDATGHPSLPPQRQFDRPCARCTD